MDYVYGNVFFSCLLFCVVVMSCELKITTLAVG